MLEYTDRNFSRSIYYGDEGLKLKKTIEKLIDLSKMARHEGLLSIEDDVDKIEGDFYKLIFQMLLEGIDADVQFDFGRNIIHTTKTSGVELRNMMLWNKGIALINRGDNPWLVEKILYSMISEFTYDKKDFSYPGVIK
jgi:flagellar motor component MotA